VTHPWAVWRPWVVGTGVAAASVALWWWTAADDSEALLWRRYSAATALVNVVGSACCLAFGYVFARTSDTRPRLFRTLLLGASVVVTLGLFESAALLGYDYSRSLGGSADDTWLQLALGVNRRDPELIHVHQPHARYQGKVSGNLTTLGLPPVWRTVDVAYDRNGFRNVEDLTRADIVAIGDSFVEGAETAQDRTTVAALSRLLTLSVANLGQSNYGPQQELVVLERYGLPMSPRVVVWYFFGGNDLRDAGSYESRRASLETLLTPMYTRSFSRNALRAVARLTTPVRRAPSAFATERAFEFVRSDGTVETQYLDAPEGDWSPDEWDIAAAALSRARDLSESRGADFLVVYIPRKLRVYRGHLRAAPDSLAETWPLNDLPEVMARWTGDRKIAFLDATVPLRAAVAGGESVYLPDDVHWNAAGHRVVAQAVAGQLRAMGHVGAPPAVIER
jgi:lysophospholipase L1-like esterase